MTSFQWAWGLASCVALIQRNTELAILLVGLAVMFG